MVIYTAKLPKKEAKNHHNHQKYEVLKLDFICT